MRETTKKHYAKEKWGRMGEEGRTGSWFSISDSDVCLKVMVCMYVLVFVVTAFHRRFFGYCWD